MKKPQVSVLMACYNASQYLDEAVCSILNQTFTDFEFIVIDDGSTDDTLAVIRRYAAVDKRIIYRKKENTGLTDSLNLGMKMAAGGWIARMDADDVSLPTRLEIQLGHVSGEPEMILVGAGCTTINQGGRPVGNFSYPSDHCRLMGHLLSGKSFFPHSSAFFKRRAAEAAGGYRNRLNGAEDYDLWLRLGKFGKIGCVEDRLILLRKHSESITARNEKLVLLALAANVCHRLRQQGAVDPADGDEETWKALLAHVESCLDWRQQLWIKERKAGFGQIVNSGATAFRRAFMLAKYFLKYPKAVWLIKKPPFNQKLAVELAYRWILTNPERVSAPSLCSGDARR